MQQGATAGGGHSPTDILTAEAPLPEGETADAIDDGIPADFDVRAFVPDGWDLFEPPVARMVEQLGKGHDPTFAIVRLWKVTPESAEPERIGGEFRPDLATTAWLIANHGPGRYDVRVYNRRRQYVAARRVTIGLRPPAKVNGQPAPAWAPNYPTPPQGPTGYMGAMTPSAAASFEAAGFGQPPPNPMQAMQERLMMAAIDRLVNPPQSPIESSMAKIVELMALQQQASQSFLQTFVQLRSETEPKGGGLTERLLEKMVGAQPQSMTPQDIIGMIQMGMSLAGSNPLAAVGIDPEDEGDKLISDLLDKAEKIGFPLAMSIAASIPDREKATMAMDAIREHLRVRAAEAGASPDVVDTTGEPS